MGVWQRGEHATKSSFKANLFFWPPTEFFFFFEGGEVISQFNALGMYM